MSSVLKEIFMMAINNIDAFVPGEVYTWQQVSTVHRIRSGIYQRDGRLISLLTDFGRINPCYPDHQGTTDETIFYTGFGRRGDQQLGPSNRALADAVDHGSAVPLFNKLSAGRWEFLGHWRVTQAQYVFEEKQNRMLWKFTLQKQPDI